MGEDYGRILVTGTSGFVGSHLVTSLKSDRHREIRGTSRSAGSFVDHPVDLTDPGAIRNLASEFPADIIIHTAAISKTDVCEANKERCFAANVVSTKNLLTAFPNAKFFFFSTYAVYNTPEGRCTESAPVSATNYYIETKLLGEALVRSKPESVIFRPSVIFGYTDFERQSRNYFMQLVDNLRNQKVTRSPRDQYFNPVHVSVVTEIVKRSITGNIHGIYNIGSNEDISKFEFNRKVMQRFHFDEKYLEGISSDALTVVRPNNGTISSRLVQQDLGCAIPRLDRMIETLFQSTKGHTLV